MKIAFISEFYGVEPLGIMSLSAFLKKHGHQTELFDIRLDSTWKESVLKYQPTIICYSISTGSETKWLKINSLLKKEHKFVSFFGGMHPTFEPTFIKEEGVDVICRGEGEYSLLELVETLRSKKPIEHIEGLWIKKDGKTFSNPMRKWEQNLDLFPSPDRELIAKYPSYKKLKRRSVLTIRGCSFSCTYCFNPGYNKLYAGQNIIRRRSIDHVIEELKAIKANYNTERIQFVDDVFLFKPDWVIEFCKRYAQEINLPFAIHARVELITPELATALKEAGCCLCVFAIETAHLPNRLGLLKRNMTDEQIVRGAELLKKNKIKIYTQNMVGLPNETLEDAFRTIDLNRKIKADYSWVSIFQPYPGTELLEKVKELGLLPNQDEALPESYYDKSILKIKNKEEYARLQRWFPIASRNRIIRSLSPLLIKIPLDGIYKLIGETHKTGMYYYLGYINKEEIVGLVKDVLRSKKMGSY